MFIRKIRNRKIRDKSICGLATNDSKYTVMPTLEGVKSVCPYYKKWQNMLTRCYNLKFLQSKLGIHYKDCTVSEDWHLFTNFLVWAEGEYSEWFEYEMGEEPTEAELHSAAYLGDLCLDKDILVPNNKTYSKDTCLFVSKEINSLLNDNASQRGLYKQGVCWNKEKLKFDAKISIKGVRKHLGYFETEALASSKYLNARYQYIINISEYQRSKIKNALLKRWFKSLGD